MAANNAAQANNSAAANAQSAPLSNKELELEQLMAEYTAATVEYGRYSLLWEKSEYYSGHGTESASMAEARRKAEKIKYRIKCLACELTNEASEPPNAV